MASDLARAYRVCARATRRHARNFHFAFLSLPRAQRRAVYALYAFCREADSIADGPSSTEAKRAGLAELRKRLAAAGRGEPETERDLALADTLARYGVSEEDLRVVLDGVELDLNPMRIETSDQLRSYCYHVASAVGLATLPILTDGAPPSAGMREAAVDLGLGMQYVNVLRDIDEDLALGRIYLPSEELAARGVTESELRSRTMTHGLRSLLAAHAERARSYLDSGRLLLPDLPRRSRACPWLLSEIYGRILARIVAADYPVFERRVSLPATEKLWLVFSSSWKRL